MQLVGVYGYERVVFVGRWVRVGGNHGINDARRSGLNREKKLLIPWRDLT